jgi:ATP-dependent RNA helicase DeaD
VPVYGGAAISVQIQSIKRSAHIIVATPGRMVDLINRKKVNLQHVEYVVLDEADEMLNMGFKEDLDMILSKTPGQKNTWLFSATMPQEVERISRNYMHKPVEIALGSRNQANENIEHLFFPVRVSDKYGALKRIIDYHQDIFGIIFCRTRRETQQISDQLLKDGYSSDAIHGDLSQAQRDQVMKRFRSHMIKLLVATDVAARGIDVDDITHVINYSLPDELENYTHRSGRTARAGKKGIAVSLVSAAELNKIGTIERIIKTKFIKGKLPSVTQVRKKQLSFIIKNIAEASVDENQISAILPQACSELDHLSKEDLISRFLSMEYDRLPAISAEPVEEVSSFKERSNNVKLYINLGKYDDLNKEALATFICRHAGIEERAVTIEELKNSFSIIRIKKEMLNPLMSGLRNKSLHNRAIRVEVKNNAGGKRRRLRKVSINS